MRPSKSKTTSFTTAPSCGAPAGGLERGRRMDVSSGELHDGPVLVGTTIPVIAPELAERWQRCEVDIAHRDVVEGVGGLGDDLASRGDHQAAAEVATPRAADVHADLVDAA